MRRSSPIRTQPPVNPLIQHFVKSAHWLCRGYESSPEYTLRHTHYRGIYSKTLPGFRYQKIVRGRIFFQLKSSRFIVILGIYLGFFLPLFSKLISIFIRLLHTFSMGAKTVRDSPKSERFASVMRSCFLSASYGTRRRIRAVTKNRRGQILISR